MSDKIKKVRIRTEVITLRVTKEEKKIIEEKARKKNTTITNYMIEKCIKESE